ncbi:hypothetical protein V8Z69_07485 [Microbacterium aurugineum]|uniref:hypothetical protein n=1 Tax=Microbacterium aurugineum TaxID=2851642 RepID=UPI0039BEAD4C
MATGDDAAAAGMDVLTGNEPANTIDTEINKSRDYIAQRTNAVTPIAKGGTGATTAEGARANLDLVKAASAAAADGTVPYYHSSGKIAVASPSSDTHAANKQYVDGRVSGLVGLDYLNARIGPGATVPIYSAGGPATSGYSVAYINNDGRISRGASSERYKKFISDIDPDALGDVWPSLVRYQMRHGDGAWKYGYIAERLNEHDDQRPFVVYQTETLYDASTDTTTTQLVRDADGNPVPDSIDFLGLLMVQNAQLHQAVDLLSQRIQALEAREA